MHLGSSLDRHAVSLNYSYHTHHHKPPPQHTEPPQHTRSTNLEMLLRSSATVVNAGSGEWSRAWRHWERGWTIEAARRLACGIRISKTNSMFHAKKALFCDPKLPVKRRIDAFYSTCSMVLVNGPARSQCSGHCAFGNWEASSSLCLRRRPNAGPTT